MQMAWYTLINFERKAEIRKGGDDKNIGRQYVGLCKKFDVFNFLSILYFLVVITIHFKHGDFML